VPIAYSKSELVDRGEPVVVERVASSEISLIQLYIIDEQEVFYWNIGEEP